MNKMILIVFCWLVMGIPLPADSSPAPFAPTTLPAVVAAPTSVAADQSISGANHAPTNATTPIANPSTPEFTSTQGFSITPPVGWTVASKDTMEQVGSSVQKQFPTLRGVDFDQMAVLILNPTDSGITNLNVVVSPERMPIEDSGAEEKLTAIIRDQYKQMGVVLDKISLSHEVFGTHPALVANVEWQGAGSPMQQWQVMLLAESHTLIVTCTAPQSSFEEVRPLFTKAIESMKFSNFEWAVWLQVAFIGALIVVLYWVFHSFAVSRKKKQIQG